MKLFIQRRVESSHGKGQNVDDQADISSDILTIDRQEGEEEEGATSVGRKRAERQMFIDEPPPPPPSSSGTSGTRQVW